MYQRIHLRTMRIVSFEHVEIGGVITGAAFCHGPRRDLEGLTVQIRIVPYDGQDKRVVCHHNLNIVRLAGGSLLVSNGEVNLFGSLVPHEPNQHNVWPVAGWGVVGRHGGDIMESPDLTV